MGLKIPASFLSDRTLRTGYSKQSFCLERIFALPRNHSKALFSEQDANCPSPTNLPIRSIQFPYTLCEGSQECCWVFCPLQTIFPMRSFQINQALLQRSALHQKPSTSSYDLLLDSYRANTYRNENTTGF